MLDLDIRGEVLVDLIEERIRQEEEYGHTNDDLPWGTGPEVQWLHPYTDDGAEKIERRLRDDYEAQGYSEPEGLPSWVHLIREELAEAVKESDPARIYEEMVQTAALCVSFCERIRKAVNVR